MRIFLCVTANSAKDSAKDAVKIGRIEIICFAI
jgi:hypothetical protein